MANYLLLQVNNFELVRGGKVNKHEQFPKNHMGTPPLMSTDRQTHLTENTTFLQHLWRAVTMIHQILTHRKDDLSMCPDKDLDSDYLHRIRI